jgi:hypothetical protein
MEYPANINSSVLTQSDHNNFNDRTAATFYNNASTTVKNSLLQRLASPCGICGEPHSTGTDLPPCTGMSCFMPGLLS